MPNINKIMGATIIYSGYHNGGPEKIKGLVSAGSQYYYVYFGERPFVMWLSEKKLRKFATTGWANCFDTDHYLVNIA